MDVSVGTFNLNNLFNRFDFTVDLGAVPAAQRRVRTTYQWVEVGMGVGPDAPPAQLGALASSSPITRVQGSVDGALLTRKSPEALQALAERIARVDADVLAVQEVENIDALRRFNRQVLADAYPFEVLLEGNDPRFIDVGLLSRLPVANLTSHRFEVHPDEALPIFSRDLLEVDVLDPRRTRRLLKLFVNHLKSKFVRFDDPDPDAAQRRNDVRRRRQAETVARIVDARTGPRERYVVIGDMNDAPDGETLAPMIADLGLTDALADVVETRPPPPATNLEDAPTTVRWTHRLSVARAPDVFELFDQIWVSPSLADQVASPRIERRRAWSASAQGVGSDHDPAWVTLRGL